MLSLEEENQIKAVLYGQCIGDAIGLLTEFLPKEDAKKVRKRRINAIHPRCMGNLGGEGGEVGGYPNFSECKKIQGKGEVPEFC